MRSFREQEEAGRSGAERCWCPTGKARRNVFFSFSSFSQVSPLWWTPRAEEKRLSDPPLAVSRSELRPHQLHVTLRPAGHMPAAPSECACRRRKSCGDKSVPGLCNRIQKFILRKKKGAFLRASCAERLSVSAFILEVREVAISWEKTKRPSLPPA